MAPWKCRDATSVTGMVMGVRGWNSSKTLEERSLWSCKGKSCLEGAQETAEKLGQDAAEEKSWSEHLEAGVAQTL